MAVLGQLVQCIKFSCGCATGGGGRKKRDVNEKHIISFLEHDANGPKHAKSVFTTEASLNKEMNHDYQKSGIRVPREAANAKYASPEEEKENLQTLEEAEKSLQRQSSSYQQSKRA